MRQNMFRHFAFDSRYSALMTRNRDAVRLAELYDDLSYSSALKAIRQENSRNPDETFHQTGLRLIAEAVEDDQE
jgi:hypothetical protein